MKTAKKISILLFSAAMLLSCKGGAEESTSEENASKETAETTSKTSDCGTNEISHLEYDGAVQTFDQKYAYANFNSIYQTYRVIFLNYDRAEDSDFGGRTGDQKRIVITIHNPKGGEFTPGIYTWSGDENGMNRIAAQVETAEGLKTCNYAGMEDAGTIEILEVSKDKICGKFSVKGQGFDISGTFNTNHESL